MYSTYRPCIMDGQVQQRQPADSMLSEAPAVVILLLRNNDQALAGLLVQPAQHCARFWHRTCTAISM